jgi:hypothetical protein
MKTFAKEKDITTVSYPIILDAPRYLFVSTNVSQRFPHLLESVIIQSYHTCSPPDHSTPWSRAHSASSSSSSFWWTRGSRSRGAKSFLTSLMQQFGSTSPALQRFLIHLAQPLLVSSLIYLWAYLFNHPEWFSLVGAMLVVGLYFLIVRKRRQQQDANQAAWIHPLSELKQKGDEDETSTHDHSDPPVDLSAGSGSDCKSESGSGSESESEDKDHGLEPLGEDSSENMNFLVLSEEEEQRERGRFDSLDDSLEGYGISLDFSDSDQSNLNSFTDHSQSISDQSSSMRHASVEIGASSCSSLLSDDDEEDDEEEEEGKWEKRSLLDHMTRFEVICAF